MSTNHPRTLLEAVRFFQDAERCIQFFAAVRWPDGVKCPTCGNTTVSYLEKHQRWQCSKKHSKRQFSVKVGTIFEDSPVPLEKWLPAVWLIANCKNGISSYELARDLDVQQKTAWFMLHRIRLAMQNGSFEKMSGTVEADETLIGGKARFMHHERKERTLQKGRGSAGKVVVMGLLERHGIDKDKQASRVKTSIIQNPNRHTVRNEVRAHVEPGSEVFTDALASYQGLAPEYVHEFIDHAETYVNGKVHTNGIENFWSLLKRAIKGTYVSVEPFHLFRYLDEQSFRFNERKKTDSERFMEVLASIVDKRLTYKELTGEHLPAGEPSQN